MLKSRTRFVVAAGLLLLLFITGSFSTAGRVDAAGQPTRHQVRPGENLWQIARNYNVNLQDLIVTNGINDVDNIQPGQTLIIRQGGYGKFIIPARGRISSNFGPRWGRAHEGIDIAVKTGTPVIAVQAGKVIYSGWVSGYGYTVILQHDNNVRTLYGHNSRLVVNSGQWVNQGQLIARSGNTGRSTGPHLHFEIQINGSPVNPMNYLG